MSDRPKPPTAESAILTRSTKGKRKAPSDGDMHNNPIPGPSSLPDLAASPGVGRRLPTIAPKLASMNPASVPVTESELLQSYKRPRIAHDPQPPSQLSLHNFAQPESNHTLEQPMYFMDGAWALSDMLEIETAPRGSNIQGPKSQVQSSATYFDPSSSLQNTSQTATVSSSDPPPIAKPPPIMTAPGNFQMSITEASVGCCPQCRAMLRSLRDRKSVV